jgi:VWFA-related protein
MKATNEFSVMSRILAWTGFLLLGFITVSPSQDTQKSEPAFKAEKDYTIKLAVEEVRLDVVVLDKKGHQISDLTASDFEIYQDKVQMQVQSCAYIVDQTAPGNQSETSKKSPKPATPVVAPPQPMSREQVRRVIAFVIDDLSMNFESIQYARTALKKFVDKQMMPGDVVAILRTSRGNSARQLFLADKRQIIPLIDSIRWAQNVNYDREDYRDNLYGYFDGQLSTINYCINALKDMPGRKAIVLMSNQTTLPSLLTIASSTRTANQIDYQGMYKAQFDRMAEDALRAGVVVHTLDMRGLEAPFPNNPIVINNVPSQRGGRMGGNKPFGDPGPGSPQMGGHSGTIDDILQRSLEARNPLSELTGGLFITDKNFFSTGIEEVDNALKGYYILSYTPPQYTFRRDRPNTYHSIKVKVKQSGAQVHTRNGFYGVVMPPTATADNSNPLQVALFSPFRFADVKVNIASAYMNDPQKKGYLVRSWVHLNWDDLTKTKTLRATDGTTITLKEGEGQFVSIETVDATSDVAGAIKDASLAPFTFQIKDENIPFIKEHGIRFSLTLPIKKPGAYYLRVAVRDLESGKVGSAYQFIEIPDLTAGRLALSNIFLVNSDDDVNWVQTGATEKGSEYFLRAQLKKDDGKSPAIRNYRPDESFEYMMLIYNAKHAQGELPDLEYSVVLYKDGQELSKSQPQPLTLKGPNNSGGIPIRGKMTLAKTLEEGDYILQFVVTDKRLGDKKNSATQSLDFRVTSAASNGKIALAN